MRGRILVSEEQGTYDIKLEGDVRMVLCTSLNRYIESIFREGKATQVLIDLLDATGVDSTTLGLLVKLAIYCNCEFHLKPQVFCVDDGLNRTLVTMGIDEVCELHREAPDSLHGLIELECGDANPEEYRQQVLEAHRLLIKLNPANHSEFIDLIRALEAE